MDTPNGHLPDPDMQAGFYADVNSKRLVAFVVDAVLVIALSLVVVPFTAFTGLFFFPVLITVTGFAYRVLTLSRRSATWGMRLMAIEFRDGAGRRLDTRLAVLHTFGLYLCFWLPVLQVISVILMLLSERNQGLSDRVLNTVLLNQKARF